MNKAIRMYGSTNQTSKARSDLQSHYETAGTNPLETFRVITTLGHVLVERPLLRIKGRTPETIPASVAATTGLAGRIAVVPAER